jgi:hypothetical protein
MFEALSMPLADLIVARSRLAESIIALTDGEKITPATRPDIEFLGVPPLTG